MKLLPQSAPCAREWVALAKFLRLIQADVWRTCSYTVDAESADDLARKVTVRMVGSPHRVTANHQIRGSVPGIARHVCLDEIRHRQRRRATQSELANGRPTTVTELDRNVTVRDLVVRLDPERREAFVPTQFTGPSHEDTERICGCPVGTTRSGVARPRPALRDTVTESKVTESPVDLSGTLPPPSGDGNDVKHPKSLAVIALLAIALASCGEGQTPVDTTDSIAIGGTTATAVSSTVAPAFAEKDSIVRISVTVGVDAGPDRIEDVSIGDSIELTMRNPDEDDEFHVHGFDLGGEETPAGEQKIFAFTATEAGDFGVESHVSGEVLVVIRVS